MFEFSMISGMACKVIFYLFFILSTLFTCLEIFKHKRSIALSLLIGVSASLLLSVVLFQSIRLYHYLSYYV